MRRDSRLEFLDDLHFFSVCGGGRRCSSVVYVICFMIDLV